MKKIISLFFPGLTGIMLSGCTLLVSQGGKDMSQVFKPSASVTTVRRQLGKPSAQLSYPQPLPASSITELVELAKLEPGLALTDLIGSREDYAFEGRIYNDGSEGVVMCDVLTGGLFELFMFPVATHDAVKESHRTHRFRVWYRADNSYFAYVELVEKREEPK